MSTTSAALTDSRIMLRRNLKHILRNPVTIFNGALMAVVIMLLFVYVLGNAFNVGEHYIEYATPGLILLAITYGLSATAVSVNSDMTKGIINRFKVMNVSRGAVLTGHVAATMLGSSVTGQERAHPQEAAGAGRGTGDQTGPQHRDRSDRWQHHRGHHHHPQPEEGQQRQAHGPGPIAMVRASATVTAHATAASAATAIHGTAS